VKQSQHTYKDCNKEMENNNSFVARTANRNSFSLPAETLDWIDREALKGGTKSAVVQRAIIFYRAFRHFEPELEALAEQKQKRAS
jgi:hypothetical protein